MQRTETTKTRLAHAASQLFYQRGISATSTDAVAAAAGLTKPTLYAHFNTKTELVAAALHHRHQQRRVELEAWLASTDPGDRPQAVFAWLAEWYDRDGGRGCGFLNAAAELTGQETAAQQVVRAEKEWLLGLLTGLCEDAGLNEPKRLASQLLLLIDGVAGRVLVHGPGAAADAVSDATQAVRLLTTTGQA